MHERDRMKCKACRLYSDCGISLRTSGKTLCVEPSVVSDEETTEVKADCNNENEDNNFFCYIISEICNYAVKHGMKSDETIKEIAKDMLAMLEFTTFNAWTISEQEESEGNNGKY